MLLVVIVKEHINTTPGTPLEYLAHTPEMSITPVQSPTGQEHAFCHKRDVFYPQKYNVIANAITE